MTVSSQILPIAGKKNKPLTKGTGSAFVQQGRGASYNVNGFGFASTGIAMIDEAAAVIGPFGTFTRPASGIGQDCIAILVNEITVVTQANESPYISIELWTNSFSWNQQNLVLTIEGVAWSLSRPAASGYNWWRTLDWYSARGNDFIAKIKAASKWSIAIS